MHLKNLELNNFRNYKNVNLNFDRNTILIIGDNGQGKTKLLEFGYNFLNNGTAKPSCKKVADFLHFNKKNLK
jgi:DNA replication and repair protein RecF